MFGWGRECQSGLGEGQVSLLYIRFDGFGVDADTSKRFDDRLRNEHRILGGQQ